MKSIKKMLSIFLAMAMVFSVSAFAADAKTCTLQSTVDGSKVDTVSLSNIASTSNYGECEVYHAESSTTVSFLRDTDNHISYYCSGDSMDDYQKWIDTTTTSTRGDSIEVASNTVTLTKAGVYSVTASEKSGMGGIDVFVIVSDGSTEDNTSTTSNSIEATPTTSKVLVNGSSVSFDAYTINGNNYFKLRDLAMALKDTNKKFQVIWDDTNKAISLKSGSAYTAVGGELAAGNGNVKSAVLNASKVYKDSAEISLTAYTINGNNYFKLRDIGKAFNFGVGWDGSSNTVSIDTSTGYTE